MAAIGEFASQLGLALLKGIAGKIGALIFDSIFPPSVPSYFAEVYKKIQQLVHDELTQNVIDELNGKTNGVKDFVQNTYTPMKNSGDSDQVLYDKISPVQTQFVTDVIGVLEEPRYASGGFTGYMIAAGMNLALLQELALVTSGATKSGYMDAVKKNAASHADHAQKIYDKLIQARKDAIVLTSGVILIPNPIYPYGSPVPSVQQCWFEWEDKYTGDKKLWSYFVPPLGGEVGDLNAESDAKKGKEEHTAEAVPKFIDELDNPQDTIDKWKKLTETPLPPQ